MKPLHSFADSSGRSTNILYLLTYLLVLLNYWMMLDSVVCRTKRLTCTYMQTLCVGN